MLDLNEVVCRGWKVWIEEDEEMVCMLIVYGQYPAKYLAGVYDGIFTKATVTEIHEPFEGL